ncbi:hypothetical protein C2W62_44705, partial [Candidatus Entotheonella serta]
MRTLKLLAKIEHLPQWMQFITDCAQERGLPSKRIREIELALEEVIVNVCRYTYPEEIGEVEVTCTVDTHQRFIIEIVDGGGKPLLALLRGGKFGQDLHISGVRCVTIKHLRRHGAAPHNLT